MSVLICISGFFDYAVTLNKPPTKDEIMILYEIHSKAEIQTRI